MEEQRSIWSLLHPEGAVDRILNQPPSKTDPAGSYTGRPAERGETPVQDADDL